MSDDVVDVGIDELGGEEVAVGGHVTVQEEAVAEILVVERAVFIKVDDVGVVEKLGQAVEKIYHLRRRFVTLAAAFAREGYEEELRLGADLLVAADDRAVKSREGFGIVVMPIVYVDILDRSDGHMLVVDIVDA